MTERSATRLAEIALRDLPISPDLDSDFARLRTADVLSGLARADAAAPQARASLDALCRKIHIARVVYDAYSPTWGKHANATPVSAELWRLLLAVLLRVAEGAHASDEEQRGLALKCLNAAFAGLDLAHADAGTGSLDDLETCAREILARLDSVRPR